MVTVRTELYKGGHTGHRQWSRDHSLFRIRFVVIVAPFCKGQDSIGAHIPVLVTGNIFLQFFPILQPAWLTGTHPVFRGMAHRPSVVRSTFRCLVSWTLRHGMASLSRQNPRACSFSHQRFQWHIRGSNSTLCEFV